MMNNRLIICALLPKDTCSQIEFEQRQYVNAEWHITLAPHVTLLRPGTGLVDIEQAKEQFFAMKLQSKPTQLRANRVGMFMNGPNANVVYLSVERTDELRGLHDELRTKAAKFVEAATDYTDFIPHITIANNVADEQTVDSIVDDVSAKNIVVDYTLDRIHMFKKADDDPKWVWVAEKLLG